MLEKRHLTGPVTVLMPTYNESGHILDLIQETIHILQTCTTGPIEILVIDDNSPDKTWELVQNRAPDTRATVRVIRRMKDRGLTNSLRDGIDQAQHELILWFDCDFSQHPRFIPQLFFMLDQGYDLIVNSRFVMGGGDQRLGSAGRLQRFLSHSFNWVVRMILEPQFSDYTSGFILVRKSVLRDIRLQGDYGEYFIDLVFRAVCKGVRVCELPYQYEPRRSGESKTGKNIWDFMRRGRKYILLSIRLVWSLRWKPYLSSLFQKKDSQEKCQSP